MTTGPGGGTADLDRLAQIEARLDDAAQRDADVIEALTGIRKSLKSFRGSEKRGIGRVAVLLARLKAAYDVSLDERFLDVATPLVQSRRTMLDLDRLFTLWESARNAAAVDGAAAEIGTFRGGSAALVAEALRRFGGTPRELHVVDTFEGHLDASFSAHDDEVQRGKFQQTQFEDVKAFLGGYPGAHVHMGDGPMVVAAWPERRYSLVHLDVDLYQPTLDCLRYFGPRLSPGAVLIVDDYEAPACPGIRVAVEEHLAADPGFQTWRLRAEQIVLVKR